MTCVIVGSEPRLDETKLVEKKLDETPGLRERVRLLPACNPDKVWDYLCAADIFAFPSHTEGMPNSLLEAMAMGVPAIAFAIPPILEIADRQRAIVLVPPLNSQLFSEAILHLAAAPEERLRLGEAGKTQVMGRFVARNNIAAVVTRLRQLIHEPGSFESPSRLS